MKTLTGAILAALAVFLSCVTHRVEVSYSPLAPAALLAQALIALQDDFAERRASLELVGPNDDEYRRDELLNLLDDAGDRVYREAEELEFPALADYFRELFSSLPDRLEPTATVGAGRPRRGIVLAGGPRPASRQAARTVRRAVAEGVLAFVATELDRVRRQAENDDLELDISATSRPSGMLLRLYPRFRHPEGKVEQRTDGVLSAVRRGTYVYSLVSPTGEVQECWESDSRVGEVCAPLDLVRPERPYISCETFEARGWHCRVEDRGTGS